MPLVDGKFIELELPSEKHARVLFDDSRPWMYRVLYGGRSGAKDWSIAAACIEIALRTQKRFLFTREIQHTIKQSAHQLLRDTIDRLGYNSYFHVTEYKITCKATGSFFVFMGLKDLNKENVKSIEGINICVVCEAQDLTKESFDVLDPTIRQEGGEIWIQFNPQFDDDFVYEFCVTDPPSDMICEKVTYLDNKFNSDRTIKQAERMRIKDPEGYRHTWLGDCMGSGSKFYPCISKDVHFTAHECNERLFDFKFLASHAQLFMAMDPHTVYYPACIWVARLKMGKEFFYVVYNEFPTKSFFDGEYYYKLRKELQCTLTMNDLATMFRVLDCTVGDDQLDVDVVERYVDTRFAKASGAASWSTNTEGLIAEFAKPGNGGIVLRHPEERIIDVQKEIIREATKYNEEIPVCSINQSRFLVLPHCHNVKDTLLNHRNNRDNTAEDEKRKDFSDALRICFAGMSRYDWKDPKYDVEEKPFVLEQRKVDLCYTLS
ncbi:MAG: PBSX family phage terminase large subunit [Candidatus Latescibacteria bacterium]|nr:PBSX family phage terminase large subunit [Candidatus Latescibacterota bacterium]